MKKWDETLIGLRRLLSAVEEFDLGDKTTRLLQLAVDLKRASDYEIPIPAFLKAEALHRAARVEGWDNENFDPAESALPIESASAQAGSASAMRLLARASHAQLFPDQIPPNMRYRWLTEAARVVGDSQAIEELASLFDERRYVDISYQIADNTASQLYVLSLHKRIISASIDRNLLFYVANSITKGQGYAFPTMKQAWQQALYYWMRTAQSHRPLSLFPKPADFSSIAKTKNTSAIINIASCLVHGKGVERDIRRAASLLYKYRNSGASIDFEIGRLWQDGLLRPIFNRSRPRLAELKAARLHFKRALGAKNKPFKATAWYLANVHISIKATKEGKDFLDLLDKWELKLYRKAGREGFATAVAGEALIALLVDDNKFEKLFGENSRVEIVRNLWRAGERLGFLYPTSFSAIIFSSKIGDVIECSGRRLKDVMPPVGHRESKSPIKMKSAYGVAHHDAVNRVNSGRISDSEMHWLELRCHFAKICKADDWEEWDRLCRNAQIVSVLPRLIQHIYPESKHRIRSYLHDMIKKSTQDIGLLHNRTDSTDAIIPYTRKTLSKTIPGWSDISKFTIEGQNVQISGKSSNYLVPLITMADIRVLLMLALLEDKDETNQQGEQRQAGSFFSFSLEPLQSFTQSDFEWRFLRKVFYPNWLCNTDVGRSMYLADNLLGNITKSVMMTAGTVVHNEPMSKVDIPIAWDRAREVEGFSTSYLSRLMLQARRHPADPPPPGALFEKGGRRITLFVGTYRGFVDGGQITEEDGEETRTQGAGNWRCWAWRSVLALSEHYDEMAEAFPVFRRVQLIKALYATMCKGLVVADDAALAPLKRQLTAERARYQKMTDPGPESRIVHFY